MLSLDEVKQYLRVDSSDEDDLLKGLIDSAESLVFDVSRRPNTEDAITPIMKVTAMYAVAYLYEHREEADHHALTLTLRALLFGVREAKF